MTDVGSLQLGERLAQLRQILFPPGHAEAGDEAAHGAAGAEYLLVKATLTEPRTSPKSVDLEMIGRSPLENENTTSTVGSTLSSISVVSESGGMSLVAGFPFRHRRVHDGLHQAQYRTPDALRALLGAAQLL